MEISSYHLKLSGKAELPREIEIGSNYHISLEGSITNFTESDNDDGSHSRMYTFKPVKVELLDPQGKALKLKDTRSKSQLLRARFYAIWREQNVDVPYEKWYDELMDSIRNHAAEVVEMFAVLNK